jgi:hypothetical protein
MSTPVVENVMKTGAVMWYAPVGEAKPDETSVAFGAAWGGNWERVGFTKSPLALAYADEQFDMTVEEHLGPINRVRVAETLALETTLAELAAEYLQLAAGDQDSVTTTAAGAGQAGFEETGLGDEVQIQQYAWGFEGEYINSAGVSFPMRFFVHKGTGKLNGNIEFSKKSTDYAGIPLQIQALVDTTQSAGQRLALFQRVTAAATS